MALSATRVIQRTITGQATEPLPAGLVTPSLNAMNVHDHGGAGRGGQGGGRPDLAAARRVALVLPDTIAKVSLLRFEKVPPKAQDLEQLIKLADAEGGAVPRRGCAGGVDRGRPRPAAVASIWSCSRARDIVESYERACDAAGVHAGIVDIASLNLVNAVARHRSRRRAGDWLLVHAAPDYATLVVVRDGRVIFFRNRPAEGRAAGHGGPRPPDRDVLRGSARRRRVHPRRAGRASSDAALTPTASGGRSRSGWVCGSEPLDVRTGVVAARPHRRGPRTAGRARASRRRPPAGPSRRRERQGAGGIVLRTNLSTRPFYNERAIHVAIGAAALVVLALTVWNVVRIVTLSRQNTELVDAGSIAITPRPSS